MKIMTVERVKKGWSRAELGRQSRVHPARVGQIELGNVRPYDPELGRIAAALDWPADLHELLAEAVESHSGATG